MFLERNLEKLAPIKILFGFRS